MNDLTSDEKVAKVDRSITAQLSCSEYLNKTKILQVLCVCVFFCFFLVKSGHHKRYGIGKPPYIMPQA